MPTIEVAEEVKGKAEKVFDKLRTYCDERLVLKELGNLKPKVSWKAGERTGKFSEKGVVGVIRVEEASPCRIVVTMDIPLLMFPIKGILAEAVRKHLARFA